ncbi:MAG: alpha/beta fold hydrolase [Rikenellaceae bacterium]
MYQEFMGSNPQMFTLSTPFTNEAGVAYDELRVAYHHYGTLSPQRDNVIWVCHALTANSDCADWWKDSVVQGGLLDPQRYYIVCANKLGSCYGSSSGDFTMRDNIRAFSALADYLGVGQIQMLIGGSTGGAQAMEWGIMEPERIERIALLATLPKMTSWVVASSETQRMAIESAADKAQGVATARAISMLLYRNETTYNMTQTPTSVGSYQRYQGLKLSKRFDYRSYLSMLYTLDTHDVGRDRGGVDQALSVITARTVVIAINSDILFPAKDVHEMARAIKNSSYHIIQSDYGHDGFLIEMPQIRAILQPVIDDILKR